MNLLCLGRCITDGIHQLSTTRCLMYESLATSWTSHQVITGLTYGDNKTTTQCLHSYLVKM